MHHDDHKKPKPPPQSVMVGHREVLGRFVFVDPLLWRSVDADFPVRVTRSWFDRITAHDDPLARQVLPSEHELTSYEGDSDDPVGELGLEPVPWVIRKHKDRVLLLVTRRCHLNCRYCFRRNHTGSSDPSEHELDVALDYIRHSGAQELILSGGDPLAVSDQRLLSIIDRVRDTIPVIRIHTRAPITIPQRITDELVLSLRARAPVWMFIHANHPDELSDEVRVAIRRLVDAGVPVLNQTVLLAGVNDDAHVLSRLFELLVTLRVRPYYLHHPDKATGNGHFRLDANRGLSIYEEVERRVSGLALPRYVIDPPDGSGKISVRRWLAQQG